MSRSHHHRRRVPRVVPGSAPGHLALPSDALPTTLRATRYDADSLEPRREVGPGAIASFIAGKRVTWLEVIGLGTEDVLREVARELGIPPHVFCDIVQAPQRLRFEALEGPAWYAVLREPVDGEVPVYRQVSFFVRGPVVVTFHEQETDVYAPLRERINASDSSLRAHAVECLVHRLTGVIVDSLFPILEHATARLDEIEDEVEQSPSAAPLRELYAIRRLLRGVHRVAVPLRDTLLEMTREGDALFDVSTRPLLFDVHDHAAQLAELSDQGQSVANDVGALIQSSINLRMNRSMRALTIVATIFIPLHFVVGLYGMNFDTSSPWNMPELGWRYGYPAVLLLMSGVVLTMAIWMRRHGFLSDQE